MTKQERLIKHLKSGRKVTRLIAMHEFDLQNLTATISKLIAKGHNIKKKTKTDTRGTPYTEYYLGKPHSKQLA
jgi:hypothetical protein